MIKEFKESMLRCLLCCCTYCTETRSSFWSDSLHLLR